MVSYSVFNIFYFTNQLGIIYKKQNLNNAFYFRWFVVMIKNNLSKQLKGEHAYFSL